MQDLTSIDLGRYHMIEKLGQGGMAVVYKAHDSRLDNEVAVKFLRIDGFYDDYLDTLIKRFEREARALAKLSYPNIVKVIDYGEFEKLPYFVMEYHPGGSLKKILGSPIPYQLAAKTLVPVARALSYAHQNGIIHRDVKPANILISKIGAVQLTDFGIAKLLDPGAGTKLTETFTMIGTPEYMAPEQAMGRYVDHRADIYALGVVLYEMVTGQVPFTADTPMAIVLKHANDSIPSPSKIIKGLPESVERVLLKALAKQPEDRYQQMDDFAAALEDLAGSVDDATVSRFLLGQAPISPEDPAATRYIAPDPKTQTKTQPPQPVNNPPSRRLPVLIGGAALLLILAFLVYQFVLRPGASARQASSAETGMINQTLSASPSPEATMLPTLSPSPVNTEAPTATAAQASSPTASASSSGAAIQQLTTGKWDDSAPAISNNGQKIVYLSTRYGNNDVFIMDWDGSNVQRLTSTSNPEDTPWFSPDDQKIVFGLGKSWSDEIYQMNVDGSNLVNLTYATHMGRPKYISSSPDQVVYDSTENGKWDIYTATIADNKLTGIKRITTDPGFLYRFPSYIPSLDAIIYRKEVVGGGRASSSVEIYYLKDGTQRVVSGDYQAMYPIASPDGKWIFFLADVDKTIGYEMFRINTQNWAISAVPLGLTDIYTMVVSPDNQWMILAAKNGETNFHLYRIPMPR